MLPEALGPGGIVLLVGPSGAGKDALLNEAARILDANPHFCFPKRLVTRPPGPGEDHEVIAPEAFERGVNDSNFALSWMAHGLGYAIPRDIDDAVRRGALVVANVSRRVLPAARARYETVRVVLVTAPEAVRLERLVKRGRETADEIEERLSRQVAEFSADDADAVIENVGTLEEGTKALAQLLMAWQREDLGRVPRLSGS